MTLSNYKTFAAAVGIAASVFTASSASAVSIGPIDYEGSYYATSVTTNNNDHTVWLPGLFSGVNAYWQFLDGPGDVEIGANNATFDISGTIQNNVQTQYRFELDASFVLRTPNDEGTGDAKRGGIKAPLTASVIDTWSFFDFAGATLTGLDALDGLTMTLTAYPNEDKFPFQLGDGANDKNAGLGAAVWFSWAVETTQDYDGPAVSNSSDTQHGDINVNLAPVPLPAAAWMLIAGLGGLGAMRRRQTKS